MAPRAPDEPARRGARVEHAPLSLAGRSHGQRHRGAAAHACPAPAGPPLHRRGDRGRARRRFRQDRTGRPHRLPAGTRPQRAEDTVTAMDSGTFSGIVTAALLLAFVAGVLWAWSSKRKMDFEQAARLPLDD